MKSNFFVYLTTAAIILGWWLFAFYPVPYVIPPIHEPISRVDIPAPDWNKENLRDALLGDVNQMRNFLQQWKDESIALNLPFLPPEEFDCAMGLCDKVKENPDAEIRYFPQTFSSATYLLALVHPKQICSLPEGLRRYAFLYPEEKCCTICTESNRYRAEKLSLQNPQTAFVTSYTDPFTVEILEQQGIQLIFLESENTLESIDKEIEIVGSAVNQNHKAHLLRLFLKAGMLALDNRAQWIRNHLDDSTMVVYYQLGLQIPANKSLTGHLLQRMNFEVAYNPVGWRLPLSEEKLLSEAPARLIIITDEPENAHHDMMLSSAILQLDAVKQRRFCYIPNYIQQQSNQFIVLAYMDLVEALRI